MGVKGCGSGSGVIVVIVVGVIVALLQPFEHRVVQRRPLPIAGTTPRVFFASSFLPRAVLAYALVFFLLLQNIFISFKKISWNII